MSFRLVEVDNQGFQILDEDGNAVSLVTDADGIIRLAVDAKIDHSSARITNADLLEEMQRTRRELTAIRLHFEEITGNKFTSQDVNTEEEIL